MLGITYYNMQYYNYSNLLALIHDFKTIFEEVDFLNVVVNKNLMQTEWSEV